MNVKQEEQIEDLIKSIDKIVEGQVFKIVISNKKNKEEKYNKININLKENKTILSS